MTRRRLGELLLERGWIGRADLSRALKAQKQVGGRLGTCLVEGEALSEEMLARGLAEQLGMAAAAIEDLRQVDPETLALVPKALAVRCRSIPLRATGSRLDIATSQPHDLACQDEIAFATSRRVRVLIATEARVLGALARYYGEPAPARFVGLIERLDRRRVAAQPTTTAAADELFPEERPGRNAPPSPEVSAVAGDSAPTASRQAPSRGGDGPRPARPAAVPLSQSERAALFGAAADVEADVARLEGASAPEVAAADVAPPGQQGAVAEDPTSFASAARRLAAAGDRDEIGRILLVFLRQMFDRAALFAVKSDGVHGWMGAGDGLDRERLSDVLIPFDRASVFLNLRQGANLHLGPLPPMPAHRPLLAALGDDPPGPCLLLPVRLGERLAAVLYADRDGAPVTGVDLDALRRLAAQASTALERCISLKRQAHSGPAAG